MLQKILFIRPYGLQGKENFYRQRIVQDFTRIYVFLILLLLQPGPLDNLLNLLHINIRGLFHNFTDISPCIATYRHNNSKRYEIPGYTFIQKSRENSSSGGVAANVSNKLNWQRREKTKSAKSFVDGFYRPPEGSRYLPKTSTICSENY